MSCRRLCLVLWRVLTFPTMWMGLLPVSEWPVAPLAAEPCPRTWLRHWPFRRAWAVAALTPLLCCVLLFRTGRLKFVHNVHVLMPLAGVAGMLVVAAVSVLQ